MRTIRHHVASHLTLTLVISTCTGGFVSWLMMLLTAVAVAAFAASYFGSHRSLFRWYEGYEETEGMPPWMGIFSFSNFSVFLFACRWIASVLQQLPRRTAKRSTGSSAKTVDTRRTMDTATSANASTTTTDSAAHTVRQYFLYNTCIQRNLRIADALDRLRFVRRRS